jgi:serine/threonine-protein kinase
MARLVVTEGKTIGALVELADTPVAVGRLASCDLPIDEPQASRRHFELQRKDSDVWVRDLGSKNGTFLNEVRLEGQTALKDGDRLRVGTTVICYEAAPRPLPLGTRIGPYELASVHERRVGLTIHEGRHASLARTVRVEMLDAGDPSMPAFLEHARAASAYDHPMLLAIFDAGEYEGRAYRVCEWWPHARDLEERLREGRLPAAFTLRVAEQVATGLAHIHAKGGVHGWLTPRIIRVDDAGTVKVEVFAGDRLPRIDPLRTDARIQALSISPEEARGLDATARSDVYALGCIVFRALAGVPPIDGELAQVIRAHAGAEAAPRLAERDATWGGAVDELVARLLAKKSEARPNAAEAARELAALAERAAADQKPDKARASAGTWSPTGSAPETETPRPAAPPRKHPTCEPPAARQAPQAIPSKTSATDDAGSLEDRDACACAAPRLAFDPLRAALLGGVFFLIFFLSSQGTIIVLRVLGK